MRPAARPFLSPVPGPGSPRPAWARPGVGKGAGGAGKGLAGPSVTSITAPGSLMLVTDVLL